ncbi:MAG: GTPase [Thermodesulfobacteriota bacterium]|nr:GTPase [Thermodesulfobacteriota bacterium]
MKHTVDSLGSELDQVVHLLDEPSFFSFTEKKRQALQDKASELSEKLASIEGSFLTTGLLGGTGVGKSTLTNALSGAEIASTSHRRPHTDKVLIYRHVAANHLPSLSLEDVPWHEITHEVAAVKQILLCDLPDFDSLMGEHREQVLRFMEHLDILVWVTSPEKYADGRFYELLRMVPKAKQNFYFVLNKTDLLFEGETLEAGYKKMASVAKQFQGHITENGIAEPLFYTLSAKEAPASHQLAPWNQLPTLRREIFRQRDVKQVMAIKAANLDMEVQQIHSVFQKEVTNLERFEEILADSATGLEEGRSSWVRAGKEAIDLWLNRDINAYVLTHRSNPACLIGPGHTLATIFNEWRGRSSGPDVLPSTTSQFVPSDEISLSFQRRLEWLGDRLHHRVLRENLPPSLREPLDEMLDVSRRLEGIKQRLSRIVALRVVEPRFPSFWIFRSLQFLTYLLLLAVLLFAVGGETAWEAVLEQPGAASIFRLLLSTISTLFSTKGLAALGSFALLNLFFAFRFYGRYKKLSKGAAQNVIGILGKDLTKVWEEELESIVKDLDQFKAAVRSHISAISALREQGKAP